MWKMTREYYIFSSETRNRYFFVVDIYFSHDMKNPIPYIKKMKFDEDYLDTY